MIKCTLAFLSKDLTYICRHNSQYAVIGNQGRYACLLPSLGIDTDIDKYVMLQISTELTQVRQQF